MFSEAFEKEYAIWAGHDLRKYVENSASLKAMLKTSYNRLDIFFLTLQTTSNILKRVPNQNSPLKNIPYVVR